MTVSVKPDCAEPDVHSAEGVRRVARPVRVLIVFNTVFFYGMERYVVELFDLLRPEVEPHFLLTYTTYRKKLPLLAEIERRGLEHSFLSDRTDWPKIGRPRSLRHAWQMLRAMIKGNRDVLRRSLDCDAIYLPASGYGYFALLAAPYFRLRGRRVVFGFHDLPRTWRLPLRLVSTLVSDFVHQTRFGYEFAVRTNTYLARKRTFICPGLTQSWRLCDSDPQVHRALEGMTNLLFVGQVSRHKGIDLLLDAFGALVADYPDIHLHVLGNGPHEQELRRGIASMGLESRVHLWGYRDDVPDFLRMTYLYIHPSPPSRFYECFPRGALEAMSLEVPTVCFRSGGLQEMVLHEKTGLICEEETPVCLAQNIRRFLDDTGFRSSCARSASSRFHELYSDDRIRARWIEFFGATG